ncbi:MAG TPA: hypothetical protein VHF25_05620 [Nitriliruptorales bacterium]|nr:hypothetical protein [Nitriliruptorales bacterium]
MEAVKDVAVLVGDLVNSTKLSFSQYVNTSASVYESATGGAVRVVTDSAFFPNYIQIQGDGFFCLFHGGQAVQRAVAAGITLKTFSEKVLVPRMEGLLSPRTPKTGFKAGVAIGTLAAKRVGRRGVNDIVSAGKPVNWAFKCAQAANRHQLIPTERAFNQIRDNDYLRWSCGCDGEGNPSSVSDLWHTTTVTKLPAEHMNCYQLDASWCDIHGDEFAAAIVAGETVRPDMPHHYSSTS